MNTDRPALKVTTKKFENATIVLWEWIIQNITDQFPIEFCEEPVEEIINILTQEEN